MATGRKHDGGCIKQAGQWQAGQWQVWPMANLRGRWQLAGVANGQSWQLATGKVANGMWGKWQAGQWQVWQVANESPVQKYREKNSKVMLGTISSMQWSCRLYAIEHTIKKGRNTEVANVKDEIWLNVCVNIRSLLLGTAQSLAVALLLCTIENKFCAGWLQCLCSMSFDWSAACLST